MLRRPATASLVLCLAGCSFILEEPTTFRVVPVVDAQADAVAPDVSDMAALPRDIDRLPDTVKVPDVAPADRAIDAAPDLPDMERAPDRGVDGGRTDACVESEEICDGADNDCDGATDEDYPGQCVRCGDADQQGVCGVGVFLCVGGNLECVQWLPDQDSQVACDLLDNDCDGSLDEAGEVAGPRSPLQQRAVETCGPREDGVAPAPRQDCSADPRVVGCGNPHPCVEPGCRINCEDARDTALEACALACPGMEDNNALSCWGGCRTDVETTWQSCMRTCGERDQQATRWSCEDSEAGAACVALDCPEGFRAKGVDCEPNTEICNNGVDDDGDGLVDGVLAGEDPCMGAIRAAGTTTQHGVCSDEDENAPGCEDSRRMAGLGSPGGDFSCTTGQCPRRVTLSYDYAVDREEVSIRAYHECVAAGCCLPPGGRTWALASEEIEAGRVPRRPDEPEGCAAPVNELDDAARPFVADLPVTSVSWCQARDFCNWAGKRLVTDYEFERAAAGLERRVYPWGDEDPAECANEQCCRAPDFNGGQPALCDGGLPICGGEAPEETRRACLAQYNASDPLCGIHPGATPTYANADAVTPEGLLNLTGNVLEWSFDWAAPMSVTRDQDPTGPACDVTGLPNERILRGGGFTSPRHRTRSVQRSSIFDSTRAPNLGFRCARTLSEGLCDPQVPQVPAACRPGSDVRTGAEGQQPPACAAPDFVGVNGSEAAACGGAAQRVGSGSCTTGLDDYCAADDLAGCGSFLMRRFRLPPGLFDDNEITGSLNPLFDSGLGPQGGDTLLALKLPPEFELIGREWAASFGSAAIDANGQLAWLGSFDGLCAPYPRMNFQLRTTAGSREISPVCRAGGAGRIVLRSAPIALAFSGMGLAATYDPGSATLTGTMALVVTVGDALNSRLGGDAQQADVRQQLLRFGLSANNLCGVPIAFLGLECLNQPLFPLGCNAEGQCEDPMTCTGYVLPFEVEAVRADRVDIPGLNVCPE